MRMVTWRPSPSALAFFRESLIPPHTALRHLTTHTDVFRFPLILRNSTNHPEDAPPFVLPNPLPQPPKKVKVKLLKTPLSSPAKATKRSAPDDDDVVEQQPAKRLKISTNGNGTDPSSPRKKRQLEEDGLVILDGPEEGQDDEDIIVID